MTDLHDTAIIGDSNKCRALIEQGVDVNVKNKDERTPLHFAVNIDICDTELMSLVMLRKKVIFQIFDNT